jgi:hypothetical protein
METQTCTYGTSPRPECRNQAICTNGNWQVSMANPANCPPPATTGCPTAAPPAGSGVGSCAAAGSYCDYPGEECFCQGIPGSSGNFICSDPTNIPAAPCPMLLPNAGTDCGTVDATCVYPCAASFYNKKVTATCTSGGVWKWDEKNCTEA